MSFEAYIQKFEKKLSNAKMLLLKELWDSGKSFPRRWVQSSRLLEITKQKYFDRRIRELRDEAGCDIETKVYQGNHCYRLNSNKIISGNPRFYLSASQKNKLFKGCDFCCSICGKKVDPGVQGLQADHKIPLIRGGKHEPNNWQPLCNECNVGKRRACSGCKDECLKCVWAFPEKTGMTMAIKLPHQLIKRINKIGKEQQFGAQKIILKAIESYLCDNG